MKEMNEIWNTEQGKPLPEEKLRSYLEGKLSPEEQHEVETWFSEEGLESDAVEGLRDLTPNETGHALDRIHRTLNRQLHKRRSRRRVIPGSRSVWVAVLIVLMLIVLAYIVIYLTQGNS